MTKVFRSKPFKIMRTEVRVRTRATDYFKCPGCGYEIEDIEHSFNNIEDWIVFECPMCGVDLQVEPPPKENVMLFKNVLEKNAPTAYKAALAQEQHKSGMIHFVKNFDKAGMVVSYACGPIGKYGRGTLEPNNVNCLSCKKTRAFKVAKDQAEGDH